MKTKRKNAIIYLALPYSHKNKKVMYDRFVFATYVSALLIDKYKVNNFSPITQSHLQNQMREMPGDWKFWRRVDTEFLKRCDELWVLVLPGWEVSVGVQAEIIIAQEQGIPIKYISYNEISDELEEITTHALYPERNTRNPRTEHKTVSR